MVIAYYSKKEQLSFVCRSCPFYCSRPATFPCPNFFVGMTIGQQTLWFSLILIYVLGVGFEVGSHEAPYQMCSGKA